MTRFDHDEVPSSVIVTRRPAAASSNPAGPSTASAASRLSISAQRLLLLPRPPVPSGVGDGPLDAVLAVLGTSPPHRFLAPLSGCSPSPAAHPIRRWGRHPQVVLAALGELNVRSAPRQAEVARAP